MSRGVHHCLPLRGVCQVAIFSRCIEPGARRRATSAASIFYRRGEPDHRRPGPGPARCRARWLYLGGPLDLPARCCAPALTRRWACTGVCPENSLYYVALGAALCGEGGMFDLDPRLTEKLRDYESHGELGIPSPPLFDKRGGRMRPSAAATARRTVPQARSLAECRGPGLSGYRRRLHHASKLC